MNYSNPIGLVAMPQTKNFNRQAFIDLVHNSHMSCCVVLDDLLLAASLNIEYPIYRSYTFEPQPNLGNNLGAARQVIEYIKAVPNFEKVYWQINSEPDVTILRFELYAYMIREIRNQKLPIKCVFGNFPSGAVKCGQGGDENEWFTKAGAFLIELVNSPHLIGVHEYTSYYPWYVSDGGKYMSYTTWKTRPSTIDWTLPQWHIGRNWQGIKAACDKLGIAYPKIIITEALIDHMNDIIKDPALNGYKTYRNRWPVQFPEFKLGELYGHFLIWAWETVYAPIKQIVAVTTYCYGNTGEWADFRVDDDPDYLRVMREYLYVPQVQSVPLDPTPVPPGMPSYPEVEMVQVPLLDFMDALDIISKNIEKLKDLL